MDINIYTQQLEQINSTLETLQDGPEKEELIALKANITELLLLTNDSEQQEEKTNSIDNEFERFMCEMAKEGAISSKTANFKHLEGTKCRAPHKHQWGDTTYHNAMICSVLNENEARILFTNPTHQEMLPCPYYFESDCKFTEDKCRFSHGEIVHINTLQEYIEPEFEKLQIGSEVLAKKENNLWYRAIIKRIYDNKCLVKFQTNRSDDVEVIFEHIFPLVDVENDNEVEESEDETNDEDIINMSLMITPSNQSLGNWEKHTKGIGSKLMQKMGYIIGSGLGRRSDGRIEPVTAVILPAGKSLDHCMELRERAGGDKNLFSAERKLLREKKKQEKLNEKLYNRDMKTNVFDYLNETILTHNPKTSNNSLTKSKHREIVKKETNRSLNVASLQIEEKIKNCQKDLNRIKESLKRHSNDINSQVYKNLKNKFNSKVEELDSLQTQSLNIRNEQSNRNDKKKLTIF